VAIHLAVDRGLPQSLRLLRNDKHGVFISRLGEESNNATACEYHAGFFAKPQNDKQRVFVSRVTSDWQSL
jgi:hypothetical protein